MSSLHEAAKEKQAERSHESRVLDEHDRQSALDFSDLKSNSADEQAPTQKQLYQLMMKNGVPFIGFGFLDNAIMILAGDWIDQNLCSMFFFSTMAAAGLGNLLSDVFGLAAGHQLDAMADSLGLEDPHLTHAQRNMDITRWYNTLGGVVGISIGCLLGMFPLLFISSAKE